MQPSPYLVFESYADIDAVRATLTKHLSERHDVLLIGQVGVQAARIWGANPDADIFGLIPYLKKA